MNLKEWAEKNGKTLDEAKAITGLTHWNQNVPESCDEIPIVAEDEVLEEEVAVVETIEDMKAKMEASKDLLTELMREGKTPEKVYAGVMLIGKKSKWFDKLDLLTELADKAFVAKFNARKYK